MAKQTPEGKVKEAIKKRLAHYRVMPFTQAADNFSAQGMYWMPVQGQFAVHGVHDFCGVWDGVFFSLETKAPDNKVDATEPQLAFADASHRCGGISLVGVRDASAVDRLFDMIQERKLL